MKTIKVLIAATEELHDEKIQFSALIEQLNEALRPRGIELERIKWNPETDGSIEDYLNKLKDCEICLTLFWQDMATDSEVEFDATYSELKAGNNPQHIYVFFREPAENLTEELKTFKNSIETKYGHFFCRFENVDTMNLHFILKFLKIVEQFSGGQKIIFVRDGEVIIGNHVFAHLDDIPFAALNKEYQQLRNRLSELDAKLATFDKADLSFVEYSELENERAKIAKEFQKLQEHLLDKASFFYQLEEAQYTDRLRKAKEAFDKGNSIEADEILDEQVLCQDILRLEEQRAQTNKNYKTNLDALYLKTKTVIDNTGIPFQERIECSCRCFREVIRIANIINEETGKYLLEYADFLSDYLKLSEAESAYQETLTYYKQLIGTAHEYDIKKAKTLLHLADLQLQLNHIENAFANCSEAVNIYQRLAEQNHDLYDPELANALRTLGSLQHHIRKYSEAEESISKALRIYQRFEDKSREGFESDLANTLHDLANLQAENHQNQQAEENYTKALQIYLQLEERGVKDCRFEMSMILGSLSNLHFANFHDAEASYLKVLGTFRDLANKNPYRYDICVIDTLNNLALLYTENGHYSEAEEDYKKALDILLRLPDVYKEKKAVILLNYGKLQYESNRNCDDEIFNSAESKLSESLKIFQRLAQNNPNAFDQYVAMTLINLGCVLHKVSESNMSDRYNEAEDCFTKAISIYTKISQEKPNVFAPYLATTLYFMANLQCSLFEYHEAQKCLNEALDIFDHMEESTQRAYEYMKALILLGYALMLCSKDIYSYYEDANSKFLESIALYRHLVITSPDAYNRFLANALGNYARFLLYGNHHKEAKEYFNEALIIYEHLEEVNKGLFIDNIEYIKSVVADL